MSSNAKVDTNSSNGDSILSNHYGNHCKADSYDNAYFYEPGAYMEHLVALVRDQLKLTQQQRSSRCILDIGGGTGTFSHALIENDDTGSRVVVVEPFLGPEDGENGIAPASTTPPAVSFVKASAEDFLAPPKEDCWRTQLLQHQHGGYDQILVKEVVHHFHEKDRVGIFRGMREGLRPAGETPKNNNNDDDNATIPSVLIITRPKVDIDYPLWGAAREIWKANQPGAEELEDDLRAAGYAFVEKRVEPIECNISLSRWQGMVRSRCWSTFSNFTDDELEDGCSIIAEEARKDPRNFLNSNGETILRFEDRLIFLAAA